MIPRSKRLLLSFTLMIALLSVSVLPASAQSTPTPQPIPDDVVLEEDIERPEWQLIELTDARTGEPFTLGDFYGKVVFVEPMATWCTTCRTQMRNIVSVIAELEALTELNELAESQDDELDFDPENIVFIGLSVETNLNPARLADYVDAQGFEWTFAVIPVELLALLVDEFGRSVLNPPSTPKFIIRPDGTFTDLANGIKSPEQVLADLLLAFEESAPTFIIEEDEDEDSDENADDVA